MAAPSETDKLKCSSFEPGEKPSVVSEHPTAVMTTAYSTMKTKTGGAGSIA